MRHVRGMAAAIIGVAVALFATGVAWAADADPDRRKPPRKPPVADRSPNPPRADKHIEAGELDRRIMELKRRKEEALRGRAGRPPEHPPMMGGPRAQQLPPNLPQAGRRGPAPREGHPGRAAGPGGGGMMERDGRRRMMGPGSPSPMHDRRAPEGNPEMLELLQADRELEHQTRRMAAHYREAPESKRAEIKEQLEEMVNKHFDIRQKRRGAELERLEKELSRVKNVLERREKARKMLIQQRIGELVGDGAVNF